MKGRGGVGGGMLKFLVLLLLHVATLHRCLVVLLRCIHEGGWVWKNSLPWNGENQLPHWNNRCRMEWCQRLHPQLVVFKEQRSSPLCEVLAVEICESACPSPAKNNFNNETPALKKKKRKNLSTCSNEMNPKPTRNAHFAKFSRENLAQFGLQTCLFRSGENVFFEKRCFYEHGFRSAWMYMYMYISVYRYSIWISRIRTRFFIHVE